MFQIVSIGKEVLFFTALRLRNKSTVQLLEEMLVDGSKVVQ